MDLSPYAAPTGMPAPPPPAGYTPAGYAPAGYAPAGYAANQPGQPRTALPIYGTPLAPAMPSAGPVQVLGFTTAALLGVQVLLMLGLAGVSTWSVITYAGTSETTPGSLPPDTAEAVLSVLLWGLVPLCGLAFVIWLLLATRNARSWGTAVRRQPGWAIGAWFVPVVNLWWPKQMVDDVWRGSHPAAPAGTPLNLIPRSGLSFVWWGTWLIAPTLLQIGVVRAMVPFLEAVVAAVRSGATTPPVPDLIAMRETIALWSLWAYVLWSVCAFAAAVLVVQVTVWQRQRLTPA